MSQSGQGVSDHLRSDDGLAMILDLAKSGLKPEDIKARLLDDSTRAATNCNQGVQGYVIPYQDIYGQPAPFYRARLIDHNPKYKQTKGSSNHVYFPPAFKALAAQLKLAQDVTPLTAHQNVIILTEGEKKAAKACKEGFLAAALSGVDSWRNRTLILPKETELRTTYGKSKKLTARLPNTETGVMGETWTLAQGLGSLADLAAIHGASIIIIFDTDGTSGLKFEVQRAAAQLGYALRSVGLPADKIRLLELPLLEEQSKTGLDDFLVEEGADALKDLILANLSKPRAFPRHPNPRGLIESKLNQGIVTREDAQQIGFTVLAELDARGRRMRDKASGDPYFFDEATLKLLPAPLLQRHGPPFHETSFGQFLYKTYGLGGQDSKVLSWLASQMTGEDPVQEVDPRRVLAHVPEGIALQVSDSQFFFVTPDPKKPIELCSNGSHGLMFVPDQVEPINTQKVLDYFKDELASPRLRPLWLDVLKKTNFKSERDRQVAALLYYISPWMLRWRGIQLPIEVYVGEAGSGKSSLVGLRLSLLTGRPSLRNSPNDLKDWHASVTNAGGLHVLDNVHITNRDLKQRMSDELCRIITEPDPHVELRQLYTTAESVRIPIRAAFALTAIQPPLTNSDFLQRALTFEMGKSDPNDQPDSEWAHHQLQRNNGREGWIAHHLAFVHKFLRITNDPARWRDTTPINHRLIFFERSMRIAAEILGMEAELDHLSVDLHRVSAGRTAADDWVMEGLSAFARYVTLRGGNVSFTTATVVNWAENEDEFKDCEMLTNARRLGRYLVSHTSLVASETGIYEKGTYGNRKTYYVRPLEVEA